MVTVSKGSMRLLKIKRERLARAVPTLDLRRKQLNREIIIWEEIVLGLEKQVMELTHSFDQCPHPEVEKFVTISECKLVEKNIAGVMLKEVEFVTFDVSPYHVMAYPVSMDLFINLRKELLEIGAILHAKKDALIRLFEELNITTQRINLFEKRLIPEYLSGIRYIRGRLEDNERSSVMVAKIAQSMMADANT